LLNQAVFGDPSSKAAKELLAKTYDQMGYMAEAATWRNSYLTAALELRNGPPAKGRVQSHPDANAAANPHGAFSGGHGRRPEWPGCRGQGPQVNLVLTDLKESYVLWIENSVLHFKSAGAGRRCQRHFDADP
jgi:alkyl sulfatase BDS1-like metallo-beta-lactamase superfamily hydrolase